MRKKSFLLLKTFGSASILIIRRAVIGIRRESADEAMFTSWLISSRSAIKDLNTLAKTCTE